MSIAAPIAVTYHAIPCGHHRCGPSHAQYSMIYGPLFIGKQCIDMLLIIMQLLLTKWRYTLLFQTIITTSNNKIM